MDFKKLLNAGRKALTQEEAEVLSDIARMGGKLENEVMDDQIRLARQASLQDTFDQAPKSAMDSADAFAQKYDPNFTMGPAASELPALTPGTAMGNGRVIKDVKAEVLPIDLNAAASGKGINPYLLGGAGLAGGAGILAASQDSVPANPIAQTAPEAPKRAPAVLEEKDEATPLKKLESLLKPRGEALRNMDFGNIESNNDVAGLSKAQEARDMAALVNNMGRAADLIGAGIARSKPIAQDVFSQQAKASDKIVEDFKARGDQEKNDPNSGISKAYRKAMERFGVKINGNPSAATIEKVAPWIVRAYEGEEAREARKENLALQLANKKEEKREKAAKLADKQVGEINDFDNGISQIQAALDKLGKHSEWTGPLDAEVPDKFVGADQGVFRAAVGRAVDAYRKAVTGAAAGDKELAKIESRLPNPSDTYDKFVAKAQDFMREMRAAKGRYLDALTKQGKDVEAYRDVQSVDNEAPKQQKKSEGKQIVKKGYNPKTNQTQFIYSDNTSEIKDGRL